MFNALSGSAFLEESFLYIARGYIVGFLYYVGYFIMILGWIWFLLESFGESIWWGLGCLFLPFVGLIFLILHWERAGRPFLVQLAGLAVAIVGVFMSS